MNLIYSTFDWCSEIFSDTTHFISNRAKAFGKRVPIVGRTVEVIINGVVGTVSLIYSLVMSILSKIGEKIGHLTGFKSFEAFWIQQKRRGHELGERGQELIRNWTEYCSEKVDVVVEKMKIFGERVPIIGKTVQHVTNGMIGVAKLIYSLASIIITNIETEIGKLTGNLSLQKLARFQEKAAEKIGEEGIQLISSCLQYIRQKADKIVMIAGLIFFYAGHPLLGSALFLIGSVQFLANLDKENSFPSLDTSSSKFCIGNKEYTGEVTPRVRQIGTIINNNLELVKEYHRLSVPTDFVHRLCKASEGDFQFDQNEFDQGSINAFRKMSFDLNPTAYVTTFLTSFSKICKKRNLEPLANEVPDPVPFSSLQSSTITNEKLIQIIISEDDLNKEYNRLYDKQNFITNLRLSSEGNLKFTSLDLGEHLAQVREMKFTTDPKSYIRTILMNLDESLKKMKK